MIALKLRSDRALGAVNAWAGDLGFFALLGFSGLAPYAFGATAILPTLLAIHLGAVLTFFLLTPFTKMAHGFYRFAALIRDAQN